MRQLKIGLLSSVIALVTLAAGCGGVQPTIQLPQTAYDFGEIRQGDVATVQLPVGNTGEADLSIKSVSTSCGCTTATVEPMVIPPNSQATLTVNYDSGLHPDEGAIWRVVYINSDDPKTPEAQVQLRGNVRAP